MAKQYIPQSPFITPFKILSATESKINGVKTLTYPEVENVYETYYCTARAYIGSARTVNDLSAEEDRLTVDSYWIPSLKKNDRIVLLDDNSVWELPLYPENINRRNQWSRFVVVRIRG